MGESKTTTNHEEIRGWVEERGGHPARVKGTESKSSVGLLRIDYPGFNAASPIGDKPQGTMGATYEKASDVPINPAGEVEDEAISKTVG